MEKLLFIVNPRSGREKIKNRLLDIIDLFIKADWEVEVHTTQAPLDALHTVERKGGGANLVVCSGGDGTLNEVICGMLHLENPPLLGYIPAGSTNDFAASLHIPGRIMSAAQNVLDGMPCAIDIGQFCQERYFVYVAAFGAFTEVSYMTPQEKKNLLGHQAYMLEGMKSFGNIKSYFLQVEAEEFCMEGEFIFGMVTNTTSVGGFKGLVSQEVFLDDGKFEVLLVRTPKTPMDLTNIASCLILKEEKNEYVHRFKTSRLKIFSSEKVDWVLDGEFGGSVEEAEIVNLARKVKIIAGPCKKKLKNG